MSHSIYSAGVLREFRDDVTRTVTRYDETGAVLSVTPYTAEQNSAADLADAEAAAAAEREAVRLLVGAIITDLKAEKARAQTVIDADNATIKANPQSYIKDCARAAKRIADAAIDLARFVKGN